MKTVTAFALIAGLALHMSAGAEPFKQKQRAIDYPASAQSRTDSSAKFAAITPQPGMNADAIIPAHKKILGKSITVTQQGFNGYSQ